MKSVALLYWVLVAAASVAKPEVKTFTFRVENWVVDFLRPTKSLKRPADRKTPFEIPDENRKGALLVNGKYPGPLIEVYENDTVEINVINNLISEGVSIHWHGLHPIRQPWADGAVGVTQAPIGPGHNYTYRFTAFPAGTHYWHSHMDGMQSAKGIRGPFVVKPRPAAAAADRDSTSGDSLEEGEEQRQVSKESVAGIAYDDERVVVLADEWRDPEVCLKLEGAMAGNDVCSDIDYASVNGQVAWGDLQKFDAKKYPYPLIDVEPGKCYRMRLIMMASNAENYIVEFSGHNTTLVSLDGVDVKPIQVRRLNMHIGERADVVLCADQKPGYYPIQLMYDYACTLTKGHFIPPGFHPVSSCKFYAFLHYTGQHELLYGPPKTPQGTGGGASPAPTSGADFDLTNPWNWNLTEPLDVQPEPEEPDVRFVVTLGLLGPLYKKAEDRPLTKSCWYMDIDGRRWSWSKPPSPLLHTKGGTTCEAAREGIPVLDIPENATTVEIVLNNLSPTAHNIHMHGMRFQVINVANFQWCNVNKTACFLMPEFLNPCPKQDRAFADTNHTGGLEALYWGCKYNEEKDKHTRNLRAPLRKDSFQVWQRSWAVIRFKADRPGVWQFHCHMEQHIPLGMIMALNVRPSEQPPLPEDIPTEGPCPVWSHQNGTSSKASSSRIAELEMENEKLRGALAEAQAKCDLRR
eukprot:jgi/Bigna1/78085/fgenesh1_pg.52_\